MLKQRFITGIVLSSLIIFTIFKLPNPLVAVVFAVVTLIGAWEWSKLTGASTSINKFFYTAAVASLMSVIWFFAEPEYQKAVFLVASLWWSGVVIMLSLYNPEWLKSDNLRVLLKYSGFLVLVPAWLALVTLHKVSPATLMFLLVLISVADIAAYFTGKKFGKNKLAPKLSPGKSREGVLGALLASIILSVAGITLFSLDKQVWIFFVVLCVLTALISVVGDLYESLLKRKAGAKDSGTILPGHGGVLDRIDSVTAAAPGFMLGLYWLL